MRAAHALLAITCLTVAALTTLPVRAEAQVSVFRLQALNESGVREGTCFVIRQETRADGTFLVLATSARLFERESRRRARVYIDNQAPVEIGADRISTPYANKRDIALLEAMVPTTTTFSALPLTFDQMSAGSLFVISGFRRDGSRGVVAQRVRFCATRTILGDRSTADLLACQGAPAIVERGVFGVVSECEPDRVPEVTPLAVSRGFLQRAAPEMREPSPEVSQFRTEEWHVIGPELAVGAADVREGEVEVPIHLGGHEALVDATAELVGHSSVKLADLTMVDLDDRRAKLRFTLGNPLLLPPYSSRWPATPALIVVHMNVVVLPKP